MGYSFSHIINAVSKEENPALFAVQEKTGVSFDYARKEFANGISAEVIAVVHPEFQGRVPFADMIVHLTRTVTDVHSFREKRELPIVSDILDKGIESSANDYVIFSNADIMLTPWFYNVVAYYLGKGHDALVINRRRIPSRLTEAPYEVMLANAGKQHIGFDCFVFKKSLYQKFFKTGICIGIPMAGNDLFYNIFTHAENPKLLANQHLTFHLGIDLVKKWGSSEYCSYNMREFKKLLRDLKPHMQIAKFPGAGLGFFKRHFRWLMNPTYHYPTMLSVDIKQLSSPRPKYPEPEIAGFAHRYYEWMQRKINFREED